MGPRLGREEGERRERCGEFTREREILQWTLISICPMLGRGIEIENYLTTANISHSNGSKVREREREICGEFRYCSGLS